MSEGASPIQEESVREAISDALAAMLEEYQPSFDQHQWPLETMRWNELVFCVLETFSSERAAKAVARAMSELDLIEVAKLAELADGVATGKPVRRARLILGLLEEAGFSEQAADRALRALCEAARAVESRYRGKVQRLLRHEVDPLVQNMVKTLGFHSMSEEQARQTVIRWLQNVLNLPIYLERQSTRAFCRQMVTSPAELVAAADQMDINVAILDELIERWYRGQQETEQPAAGGARGQAVAQEPEHV